MVASFASPPQSELIVALCFLTFFGPSQVLDRVCSPCAWNYDAAIAFVLRERRSRHGSPHVHVPGVWCSGDRMA
jgi:hypothetical protein